MYFPRADTSIGFAASETGRAHTLALRHETRSFRTRSAAPNRCAGAHQGSRRGFESRRPLRIDRASTREDDGWHRDDEPAPRPDTVVTEERARSIISRNDSPDIHFEQSINPYRGCEHGCIYCYARPSHSYLNLSAGIDFETKLFAKTNAAELLRKELAKPGYRAFADQPRRQHRSVPADRAPLPHHALDPRGARRASPSVHDHHQERADRARSGSARADGAARISCTRSFR